MNVRIRGPSGQATLAVDGSTPLSVFRSMVAEKTGIAPELQELCGGFPPSALALPASGSGKDPTLANCPISNGDVLVVKQVAPPGGAPAPTSVNAAAASSAYPEERMGLVGESEDAMLARALALSMEQEPPASSPTLPPPAPPLSPSPACPEGVGARGVGGELGEVMRRVVNSDNSCLFNAVGYVMERDRKVAPKLRQVIADAVSADPATFNEGFLGKPTEEYCTWILDSQHWGGAIELYVLSKHYGKEIAAYDIQTCRCDCYGAGEGFSERGMLAYDGLHYDALAVEAFRGAPEEVDITLFSTTDPLADAVGADAARFTAEAHTAKKFTDTANFVLRCAVCQQGLKGQKEAVEHAKATGHGNFCEY